jgi:acyl transferase domain-containing protein/NADP-dependent 3-hydroxy acid dehydrogenase YdfG
MDDHNAPFPIPLAIVGMACRLPGADNLDQYWRLLIEGRSAVVELPADRLDQDMYYDPEVGVRNKTYSKLGALVTSREFDHARCPIDPALVKSIDSVHLLMCETACEALRNAGLDPFNLRHRNTGVYIGHAQGSSLSGDYTYYSCIEGAAQFLHEVPEFHALSPADQQAVIDELVARVRSSVTQRTANTPDAASSLVAGVISKAFGLTGPYVAINSACASSLQAILLGARALQLGHIDMAIVGGASDCKGDTLVLFSHARALSSTGSRPFDAEADGIVCGEGYGALVMKTLDRALADGDRIWSVIRGLGVSSDGRGKSLWAPRKEGQIKAMQRAYRGGLAMGDIEYLEAHATATKLGDATELNTLIELLGNHFPDGKRIPITSVKANIGHSLEMAGIAGVIKTCLAMQHEMIPPAINVRELNPNIDWANAPVYVPTAAVAWPKHADGSARRAGVNAFGIGGLNMHCVLDEFTEASRALAAPRAAIKPAASADDGAVAVIGLGCVLPGASNPTEFWNLLASGRDPKIPLPLERAKKELAFKFGSAEGPDPSKLVGGFVTDFEYDWKRHKVPPKQVAQADPLQFMLLEAADQAMQDAGYDKRPFNRENAGVVVGTEFGGDFSCQLQFGLRLPELEGYIRESLARRGFQPEKAAKVGKDYSEALLARWPALIDETGSFSTSSLASRIGKTWNLMGGAAALDVGEVSGLAALSISVDMLLARDCDLMICAAGQKRMAWPFYENLSIMGQLAEGSPRSPLDAAANGQVPGEGVVVVLLKRLADAKADGDRIHAVLRGVGAAHDTSSAGALQEAIRRSFADPALRPADVGVLELGALGTKENTADEVRAASNAYGKDVRQHPLMISSVVGQMGNTVGASSFVSLLKAILELTHGELPPALGLEHPSAALAEQSRVLQAPAGRTALGATADGRRLAGVGTCSRGLAYHVVLESGSRVAVTAPVSAPAQSAAPTSNVPQSPATAPAVVVTSLELPELEKFLVNFVVEQTGYPPEVVELDGDLEADLGIDSIKKAQMFGELQEYFDIAPLANLSGAESLTLDDFPTLRHIVNFLAALPQKTAPQKAATPQAVTPPLPTPAPQVPAPAPAAAPATLGLELAELEKFLVNFVVEQTGYPPEVVELDADLEADLGIDSIKKAQMFGELQEYFDVTPLTSSEGVENLTLDDFPTLRHIVNFLAKLPPKGSAPAPAPEPALAASRATATRPQVKPPGTVQQAPAPAPIAPSPPAPASTIWQPCRFGAADPATLRQTVEAALVDAQAFETSSRRRFASADQFRLVVVADSPATFKTRLATAVKQLDNPAAQTVLEQQGIFYRPANPDTRIVFLFPGQGSQYTGMLRQLAADVPAVGVQQRTIDSVMSRLGYPTWEQLAWNESSPLGKDVWTTQISMLLADVLALAALAERGITPDAVAGHSYGEYAALLAAGAWDLEQAARVTRRRCDSIGASPAGLGGMLATTATPEVIAQLASRAGGPVFVANHNAPDQTVVGGSLPALAELERALQEGLYETRMLNVPCPFHTPLMQDAAALFKNHLSSESFAAPLVPTYSVATNELVGHPGEIGANLVAHLITPVYYADLIRKLAAQGPTVFVEVGPQQALTRLNRRILAAAELAGIACDNPSRPGVEQIVRVQALLEACGALDRPRLASTRTVATKSVAPAAKAPGQIWHFDATARRREKMRDSASGRTGSKTPRSAQASAAPSSPEPSAAPAPAPKPAAAAPAPVRSVSPPAPVQSAAPARAAVPTANLAELEKFLVSFVVEQTGYPPEVVELDADLEADLGIDSIKKAQMFGELQEYFDITPLTNMGGADSLTLDDFPTLRHILNFLASVPKNTVPQKGSEPAAPQPAPAPAPAAKAAPAPAPVPAQPAAASKAATPTASGPSLDVPELEKFLVNFVVEQTGYPPEVVELDADLEADLGIDSIKKAQMFGELQEYFDVTPLTNMGGAEGLTLDDFPTLRHIVNFLASVSRNSVPQKGSAAADAEPSASPAESAALAPQSVASAAGITAAASTPQAAIKVDMLHLRGTPYEMGRQHGLEKKTEIQRVLRRIADLTDDDWSELPIPHDARTRPEPFFTVNQLDELRGIAEAVGVPLGNLAALNLAVLNDLAANCAQVATVASGPTGQSVLHALVGELTLPAALVEMLTPFILVREPTEGWACATVTFAGVADSLVGVNGNGLAASAGVVLNAGAANNGAAHGGSPLRVDGLLARSGAIELAAADLQGVRTPRGWTACLSHQGESRVCAAEHNGDSVAVRNGRDPLVATNHCVLQTTSLPAPADSLSRLAWIEQRLAGPRAPRDSGELLAALAEMPTKGTMRVLTVVDAARGDLLLECGSVRERVHVGALLPNSPAARVKDPAPKAATKPAIEPAASDDLVVDATEGENMRFVMRVRPFPWQTAPPDFPQWKGAAAIEGQGPLADALERRLRAGGATVVRLRDSSSPEAAVGEFEWAASVQPIRHLFITSHRDGQVVDRTQPDQWDRLFEQRALVPFFVAQRMLQIAGEAGGMDDCSVVAAVDLGGDFGFSANVTAPESGFLTGFVKGLFLECAIVRGFKRLIAKAIDAPADEPVDSLAANICRELAGATNDYEISFVGGQRYGQVALPVAVPLESKSAIRPGGTWVLTGGARGITAVCGLELAKRFGLKLHLIGMSRPPQIDPAWRNLDEAATAELRAQVMIDARGKKEKPSDAWARIVKAIEIDRNLRAFADAGVSCTYHACDVADRAALARVLEEVRRLDGPIEGILHGAGIEQAARVEKKTREGVAATNGAKIAGAYNLMNLTRQDPVRHFIGFGSTSGRLGGNGQTDYSAASDMLCKMVSWYRSERPDCHAVGFHWHPWDDLGMASRPETTTMLKANRLVLMPSRVGVRHLLRELYTQSADSEVLITDWEYHQRFYPQNVDDILKSEELLGVPPALEKKAAKVADRVLLRMVDAPLVSGATVALPGEVILWGDNADARALAEQLSARGVKVHRLPVVDDAEAASAALEQVWRESPARCLVLLSARDPEAATKLGDLASAARRVERGVYIPYLVTQRFFQLIAKSSSTESCTLVAVTSLGGDFGFGGPVPAPEGGALAGMLKSIYVEDERYQHSRFTIKVLDAPADEPPAELAAAICRELESGRPEVEVAWSGGIRQTVATRRQPAQQLPKGPRIAGGNWIVTGGARGITAASALELGRRFGVKLHLLGKSPAPRPNAAWRNCTDEEFKSLKAAIVREAIDGGRSPAVEWDRVRKDREIEQSLQKFRAADVKATYHECDVADFAQLAAVLDEIRVADGPIDGIVHGAGYAKQFRFGAAPADSVRRVMAPKVEGTLALMHLTRSDPLKYFVAFGSLSGCFGGNGWSDYAAANAMLGKLCGWFRERRPEVRTAAMHWQTWSEVGMAVMTDSVGINKNTFKMEFIAPAEGVVHLADELKLGLPESEVLISDGFFERAFYTYEFERPDAPLAHRPAADRESRKTEVAPMAAPLLASLAKDADGGATAQIVFDPKADRFLIEHRLKSKPFLPAVVGIEALVEVAHSLGGPRDVFELRNVRVVNGLAFPTDNTIAATVTATASGDALACALTTEVRDRQGRVIDPAKRLIEAMVPISSEPIVAAPPTSPPLGWYPYVYSDNVLLFHGPPLRCLKEVGYVYEGGWGKILAPDAAELAGSRAKDGWLLPMAVLDACEVACGSFLYLLFGGAIEVPYEFERLRWSRTPRTGESCLVQMRFRGRKDRHSLFDFTLYGDDSQPILDAVGYRTVLLGDGGR